MTLTLRRAVLKQVEDLCADQDRRNYVEATAKRLRLPSSTVSKIVAGQDTRNWVDVIAKRLRLPVAVVSKIMAGLILEYQREATGLRVGLQSALAMAREAAAEVWREMA